MEMGNFFPKYLEKLEYYHLSKAVVRYIAVYFHVYKKRDWAFFMSWGMITYGVLPGHTGLSQANINASSVTLMPRGIYKSGFGKWQEDFLRSKPEAPVTHNPGIPVNTGSIQPQPLSVSFIFQQLLQLRGNQRYFSQEQHHRCVFSAVNVRIWWCREENTRWNKQSS